ncbi:alpha-L-fucosidase [Tetragenococcus halophilus subsp. flandriensis]|uniref:alpha-L-fucosidase n=1 Tax=Tetragenococcus halophilus TaxID=51669 RepID=UPI0023EA3C98|nr:alpha-L-fucosidase [Tetragenococcus halophilus]GMA07621.1 alpha-L-fucosidase [Tetragenococcus halophilus subsp. flandriensis]
MSKIRKDIEENTTALQENYSNLSSQIKDKLEWFQDQKIGIIFHWGLYSQAGIVESWQLSQEDDWARKKESWRNDIDTLRKDYWALNHVFCPENFEPQIWAEKAKSAGFRYMIFTTKHHDGFNMYDTQYSNYKITAADSSFHTNKKADILKHLIDAFHKKDIATGLYYSKADWHSPYYWKDGQKPVGRYASYDPKEDSKTWKKFSQYVKNQLIELVKNYGPTDILWLDGGWINTTHNEYLPMDDIASELRIIQPDLLIVDRAVGGKYENYVTPERKIPETPPKKAWESNIPLAKNWGYVPNDEYKSFVEILSSVVQVVSLGGNIILGVGPKPDGTLPKEAQNIMSQLGDWLQIYGEGIYETRPYQDFTQKDWFFTWKKNNIYAFHKNIGGKISLDLENFPLRIKKVINMETKETLLFDRQSISTLQQAEFIGIQLKLEENL